MNLSFLSNRVKFWRPYCCVFQERRLVGNSPEGAVFVVTTDRSSSGTQCYVLCVTVALLLFLFGDLAFAQLPTTGGESDRFATSSVARFDCGSMDCSSSLLATCGRSTVGGRRDPNHSSWEGFVTRGSGSASPRGFNVLAFDYFPEVPEVRPRAFTSIDVGTGVDALSMTPGGRFMVAALSSTDTFGRVDSSQIMVLYSRESLFQTLAAMRFSLNGANVSQAEFFRALQATSVFEAGETSMGIAGLSFAEDGRMFVLIHERFEHSFTGSASRVLVFDTAIVPDGLSIEVSSRHFPYEVGSAMNRMIGRSSRPSSMVFDEIGQSLWIAAQTRISGHGGAAAEVTNLWAVKVPRVDGSRSWDLSLSENVNNSPLSLPNGSKLACSVGDSILYVTGDAGVSQASTSSFVEISRLRSAPRKSPVLRIGSR